MVGDNCCDHWHVTFRKWFPLRSNLGRNSLLIGKCLGDSYSLSLLYSIAFRMRINGEEVFSNIFFSSGHIQTLSMLLKKIGSKRTNEIVVKLPEKSAILRNFAGFQLFVVKPLFEFLSFIGPFTKKGAILCSQLTLWLVNFVRSGPVQVVAL